MFCREFGRVGHGSASPAGFLAHDTVDGDSGVGEPKEAHEHSGRVVGGGFIFGEGELRATSH